MNQANSKALSDTEINSELYKYVGEIFHHRLLKFFNTIIKTGQIPKEWKRSIVLPLFQKEGKQNLLDTSYKIFRKIIN